MEAASGLFRAMQIRDAIGQLADGRPVDPRLLPFVRAAVYGACPTADRGEQQFVVDVSGCGLLHVDTEELVWPKGCGEDAGPDVPLRVVTDRELWEQAHSRWDREHPREWAAFVWRIAVPLSNRLEFIGAWQ